MNKYYLVVTGGTGMRCLEAFTHLCAMGMMSGQEIHILSIDTDANNGNKDLAEQLIEKYNKIRGGSDQNPSHDSFFSARLNLYKYSPEYEGRFSNFNSIISNPSDSYELRNQSNDLASLFFEQEVREFNLTHGYRAQTHLGSMLMYHTILQAVRDFNQGAKAARPENRALHDFLDSIQKAGSTAKVFIMGSLFGGTGASSIPILPQALQDAIKFSDGNFKISAQFGAVLLSHYFTFKGPDRNFLKSEKVVADARRFAINSQAALRYYISDKSIRDRFSRLYHIGWPIEAANVDSPDSTQPITGGSGQKNDAHVLELLCATAAYDFFFGPNDGSTNFKVVYRTVDYDQHLEFDYKDFFGAEKSQEFMAKLAAFYATCFLIHSEDGDIKVLTRKLDKIYSIHDYRELDVNVAGEINDYFKRFGFDLNRSERKIIPGWFHQIQHSTGDGDFLFISEAYSREYATVREFDYGQIMKVAEKNFTKPKATWFGKKKGYHPSDDQYQKFTETFGKTSVNPDQNLPTVATQLLGRIHNTFMKLYKHQ